MPIQEKYKSLKMVNDSDDFNISNVEYSIVEKLNYYQSLNETAYEIQKIQNYEYELIEPINKFNILRSNISDYNKSVLLRYTKNTIKTKKIIDIVMKLPTQSKQLFNGDNLRGHIISIKKHIDSNVYGLKKEKEKLLELYILYQMGKIKNMNLSLNGPESTGKCLHPDTLILLYFGGMKRAKDINRGDILIGDDNMPRIVMSTNSGNETMYKIMPEFSDSFIVNEPHILTLHNDFNNSVIDISLKDYMDMTESWKAKHKLFYISVEYQKQDVKNDPYLVGVLLGGNSKNKDDVIKDYLSKRLDTLSNYVSGNCSVSSLNLNSVNNEEIIYLINHKYIPDEYLYNTREVRYNLLKGFIDLKNKQKRTRSKSAERSEYKKDHKKRSSTPKPCRKITPRTEIKHVSLKSQFKSKIPLYVKHEITLSITDVILHQQILFIVRSLGYKCTSIRDEIIIYGDLSKLPPIGTKIDMSFNIIQDFSTEYYGFTLDKNGRFLLGSCIVTHNTHLIKTFSEAIELPLQIITGKKMTGNAESNGEISDAFSKLSHDNGILLIKSKCDDHIDDLLTGKFADEFMPHIKIDTTNANFIFINTKNKNLQTITFERYNYQDKHNIIVNHILPKYGYVFKEDAIRELIENTQTLDEAVATIEKISNRLDILAKLQNGIFSFKAPQDIGNVITAKILKELNVLNRRESSNLSMFL